MEESLLDKLVKVRFWVGMGKSRHDIAKLTGLCNAQMVDSAVSLLEAWDTEKWDFPIKLREVDRSWQVKQLRK